MTDIWSHSGMVTTMHPLGAQREVGWEEVRESWEKAAEVSSGGEVELKDQLLRVRDDVAWEIGTEHVEMTLAGEQIESAVRVTNVYRREEGDWKIVHHHTDRAPKMMQVLEG